MSEREWQLSFLAEQRPKIQLLSGLVNKVTRGNSELLATQLSGDYMTATTDFDEDHIDELLDAHAKSNFYNGLTYEQKKYVTNVLNLTDESTWRYGSRLDETNGLWDAHVHEEEIPFEREDALVLTGVVGTELIGMSKRLDRLSTAIEPDFFRRTVLLGGLALAGGKHGYGDDSNESYVSQVSHRLIAKTRIGGTIHGDFWTSRQIQSGIDITDPVGEKHIFGPAFEGVYIPAYHSTETIIMSAILTYQVAFQGVNRKQLFKNLQAKAKNVAHKPGGAYGDFGDDDGFGEATRLDYGIKKGISENEVLVNLIVYPRSNDRLIMTARADGIEFASAVVDEATGTARTMRSFMLPTDEIESYAITLLGSGYGRTSQAALANVITALRDGKPKRPRFDYLDLPTEEA